MEADLMALAPKSDISVAGTVDAAAVDGKANLTGCAPAEAKGGKAKAPADGAPAEGKAGTEKAGKQ
jgi:hypothetical protein